MAYRRVYAGIDIGGTNIKFGLVDENGKVLHKEQRPTMAEKGAVPLMHLVTNISERLLLQAAEEDLHPKGLGVGTPGAVDVRTGKVIGLCPNIAGWQGMEVGQNLRDRLNTPVVVDNDVNAMAMAEYKFGSAMGHKSVVCVTVGTGVGGAVIIDGKLWRGANYTAGELGHMTIKYDSPVTNTSMPGSIESFCSSSALLNRVRNAMKKQITTAFQEVLEGGIENLSVKKVFAALKKGDEVAHEAVQETARCLGIGLAGIVNLINPEIVVIGGGIVDGGGGFIEAVSAEIKRTALGSAVEKLHVVKATLGNDAGFIGAGLLVEMEK
jgi:glucokinase